MVRSLPPLCATVIHPVLRLAWRASSSSQEISLTRHPAKSAKCEDGLAAQVGLSLYQVADHVPLVPGQLARGKERLCRNGDPPHGIATQEQMVFLQPTAEPGQSGTGLLFVAGTGQGIEEKLNRSVRDRLGVKLVVIAGARTQPLRKSLQNACVGLDSRPVFGCQHILRVGTAPGLCFRIRSLAGAREHVCGRCFHPSLSSKSYAVRISRRFGGTGKTPNALSCLREERVLAPLTG